jgi:hypothetical protein
MGPTATRSFALSAILAAALLAACTGGGDAPSTATPTPTPTPEVTATVEASPAPEPPRRRESFVIAARETDMRLLPVPTDGPPGGRGPLIYDEETDEVLALAPGNFPSFGVSSHKDGPFLLVDRSAPGEAGKPLLIDLRTREVVELQINLLRDRMFKWLTPEIVQTLISDDAVGRPALHRINLDTLDASHAVQPFFVTPPMTTTDLAGGARLETDYVPGHTQIVSGDRVIKLGMLDGTSISPDRRRVAAITAGALIVLEAPDWAIVEHQLGPGVRPPLTWSGDSNYLAVAGGNWYVGPDPLEVLEFSGAPTGGRRYRIGEMFLFDRQGSVTSAVAFDASSGDEQVFEQSRWVGPPHGDQILQVRNICRTDGPAFTLHLLDLATGSQRQLPPDEGGVFLVQRGPGGRVAASTIGALWMIDLDSGRSVALDATRGVGDYLPQGSWVGAGRWFIFQPSPGFGLCEGVGDGPDRPPDTPDAIATP